MISSVRHTISIQEAFRSNGAIPLGYTHCGFAPTPWYGLQTSVIDGSLHAAILPEGVGTTLAFFTPGGHVIIPVHRVRHAGIVGRGLAKAIQVTFLDEDGESATVAFRGPHKRLQRIFAACGIPL